MNTTSKKDADNVSTIKHTSISNDSTTTQQQHEEAHSRDLVNDLQQQPLPFLVKTRTREEKESMRQQFKKQESMRKDKASTGAYDWLQRFYARFSTSFMLENKAAVARDHLANERTFLAWLRTSLSLITVGVGKVFLAITQLYHLTPVNGDQTVNHAKAGKALGATFVVFSIVFLYFANARYFHTQIAMTKGQFPASRGSVLFGSSCILAVLIAMFIVIILDLK